MRIKNLPSIESMDGSQDALVIEQTDGSEDKSRKVSPAQIKQYVLGNSIDDIYSVMGQNGAKNLNSYPYNETSHTDNGIAWTDNGDGTVTANNTATGNSGFVCHSRVLSSVNKLIVPNGTYILSGCPSGGSSTTFNIGATITKNGSAMALGTDNGSGAIITINGDDNYTDKAIVQIICNIKSGVAASNLTFKPMIRLASDTDNTYEPYAKTNKELTEQIAERVVKTYSDTSMRNVEANSFVTFTIALNDSVLDAVVGFSISDSVKCVPAICAFQNSKVVTMRVVNTTSSAQGFKVKLYYI